MEQNVDNVFDYVKDFYTQDEGWNNIIPQKTCEGYLRKQSWKGLDTERLIEMWEHIFCFIFYCGNADTMPGDMTVDDCLQSVGWCARNIADFNLDNDYVKDFMDVIADFYDYLKVDKIVTATGAMAAARDKLFENCNEKILTEEGLFQGKFDRLNDQGIPNLKSKVFINMAEEMMFAMEMLCSDEIRKLYAKDFQHAEMVFRHFIPGNKDVDINSEEGRRVFADYFCFDYKTFGTGRPLICDFYEKSAAEMDSKNLRAFRMLLQELTQARLMLFMITKDLGGGTYSVIDILRNQSHVLVLPLDNQTEWGNMVFCAHVFCDNTMVVDSLHGGIMDAAKKKKLKTVLRRLKQYYAVRKNGRCSWDEFINKNPLLIRVMLTVISMGIKYNDKFDIDLPDYHPAKLDKDDFLQPILPQIFSKDFFSEDDIKMALQMWADVQATDNPTGKAKEEDSTLLALAISRIYIYLCGVYGFKDPEPKDAEMKKMRKRVDKLVKEINSLLIIQKFDARYVNEEGMVLMLMEVD